MEPLPRGGQRRSTARRRATAGAPGCGSRRAQRAGAPTEGAPLFSVVTVCLNAEQHLAEALDSVLAQSCDDYEMLVVDGGSTDGTLALVREREAAFGGRLRWMSEPDSGLYDAMNKGLHRARGRYIVYLGADDHLVAGSARGGCTARFESTTQPTSCAAPRACLGPDGELVTSRPPSS